VQRNITKIEYDALQHYYDDREARYGLAISNSNRKTQNAAFNRVFDEAIVREYLTTLARGGLRKMKYWFLDQAPIFHSKIRGFLLKKPFSIQISVNMYKYIDFLYILKECAYVQNTAT